MLQAQQRPRLVHQVLARTSAVTNTAGGYLSPLRSLPLESAALKPPLRRREGQGAGQQLV